MRLWWTTQIRRPIWWTTLCSIWNWSWQVCSNNVEKCCPVKYRNVLTKVEITRSPAWRTLWRIWGREWRSYRTRWTTRRTPSLSSSHSWSISASVCGRDWSTSMSRTVPRSCYAILSHKEPARSKQNTPSRVLYGIRLLAQATEGKLSTNESIVM